MATTQTETAVPTGTWTVDPVHSTVEFGVKHNVVATFRGTFDEVEGTLDGRGIHGTARVEIGFTAGGLELVVRNEAPPSTTRLEPGHGIVGMRERAALLGGSVDADRTDREFTIRAHLPYDPDGR